MINRSCLTSLAAVVLVSACAEAPIAPLTAPAGLTPLARRDAAKPPTELSNVFRYWDDRYGFFIADVESGLILVEGAPLDPRTYWMCPGGTSGTSGKNYQEVGRRKGVIHNLVTGDDVTLHVYPLSAFVGGDPLSFICGASPIAIGTGRVHVTDSDLYGNSGHASAFTISMHGTVTMLATGERLRASGTYHHVYFPDTQRFEIKTITVRLH